MKVQIYSLILGCLLLAAPAHGQIILFEDTFNRADNSDPNANLPTGQSGTLVGAGGITYSIFGDTGSGSDSGIDTDRLFVSGNTNSVHNLGIDQSFTTATTFTVSMDVDFSKIGRAFWLGIGSPTATTGGEFAWSDADNVAFQFLDNNNVDLYESDNAAITIDSNLDPTTITSIELEVTTASFTNGAAANYDLLVNGSSIDARTFTWTSSENYITFGGWDYRSGEGPVYIDTLSVSTIPEPGAATLLLGVAGLLLLRRRR